MRSIIFLALVLLAAPVWAIDSNNNTGATTVYRSRSGGSAMADQVVRSDNKATASNQNTAEARAMLKPGSSATETAKTKKVAASRSGGSQMNNFLAFPDKE